MRLYVFLRTINIAHGWICLEIGAGAGSIAKWLCQQVGRSGKVVATDIEPLFQENSSLPQLEIRKHDVTKDEIEERQYDLVHVRHVLIHLPACEVVVLPKIVNALKPGGVVLIEESDFSTNRADRASPDDLSLLYDSIMQEVYALYERNGMDIYYGTRVFGQLCALNLQAIGTEGRMHMVVGGSDNALVHKRTYMQLAPKILAKKSVSEQKYEDFLALFDNPLFVYQSRLTIATWGYR